MDTANSTATNSFFDTQYCGFRLPCGYCTRLEKPCPMGTYIVNPTWTYNPGSTGDVTHVLKTERGLGITFTKED